jgi:hypothetical protein
VAEDQPGRVQEVTSWRQVQQLATSATAVSVVTNDRMADRRDVPGSGACAPSAGAPAEIDGVKRASRVRSSSPAVLPG